MIAPHGFTAEAVSDNLMAGNYMGRRASLQFGTHLPPGETGHVDTGLGQRLSTGQIGLLRPTYEVPPEGETLTIDGVEFVFVKGIAAFESGDYRWAATVFNHIVFADAGNRPAREWLAAALLDALVAGYNPARLSRDGFVIQFVFPDRQEQFHVEVNPAVAFPRSGTAPAATAQLTLDRSDFDRLLMRRVELPELLQGGRAELAGDGTAIGAFFGALDQFEYWFNVVTP